MKKFCILSMMLLSVAMLPLVVACGGEDNDDIVEVQGPQVTLNASNLTEYGYFDGMLYYKIISNTTQEVAVVKAEKNAVDVAIPSQVNIEGKAYKCTKIDTDAFKKIGTLTSVTIPNSVTVIGNNALRPYLRHHPQQRDFHRI